MSSRASEGGLLSPKLPDEGLAGMSSLGLAHVGDAVYELLVRTWLCSHGRVTSKELHRQAVSLVRAGAQSLAAQSIEGKLTPEEAAVFRRGRNTRVNSVPRGARLSDYHRATALETLFGWLYLRGDSGRLEALFEMIMEGGKC